MKHACVPVLLLLLAPLAAGQERKVDNPTYKAWAAYKPGTTVTLKTVSDTAGQKSETTVIHKLLEITNDKAVVETISKSKISGMEFESPPMKMDHTKVVKVEGEAPEPGAKPEGVVKEGEETIKVAGKEYKCKWYETKSTTPVGEVTAKTWLCNDVPGTLVKMESKMSGQVETTTVMELVEIKEP